MEWHWWVSVDYCTQPDRLWRVAWAALFFSCTLPPFEANSEFTAENKSFQHWFHGIFSEDVSVLGMIQVAKAPAVDRAWPRPWIAHIRVSVRWAFCDLTRPKELLLILEYGLSNFGRPNIVVPVATEHVLNVSFPGVKWVFARTSW